MSNKNLILRQIFKAEQEAYLKKPNPPTEEMVRRAQFKDKTYIWKHAGVRPRDGRSPQ
mgnify:CR=1 FL=1|jgi:hypothetical protein